MVLQKVDAYLLNDNRRSIRRSKTITASIASACPRDIYHEVSGTPYDQQNRPDIELLYKFRDGNDGQDVFTRLMREAGVEILKEEFYLRWKGIPARIDSRVRVDRQVYDIEFKRFDLSMYRTWTAHGVIAFPQYHAQTQVIAAASFYPVIFLVQNKNNGMPGEEIVEADDEELERLLEAKRAFEEARHKGVAPERPYEFGSPRCQGCNFKYTCWFSQLTKEEASEKILTVEEVRGIRRRVLRMQRWKAYADTYSQWEEELQSYLAELHERYAVKRIKTSAILSDVVIERMSQFDTEMLPLLLTLKQLESITSETTESRIVQTMKHVEEDKR